MIKVTFISTIYLCLLFAGSAFLTQARADDTVLWDLNFNDLAPNAPLTALEGSTSSPQTVNADADNVLVGADKFDDLKNKPLLFKKATMKEGFPRFELLRGAGDVLTSGSITFKWKVVIDQFTPNAKNPDGTDRAIETLMSFSFMSAPGESKYLVSIVGGRDHRLYLNSEGMVQPDAIKPFYFGEGEVVNLRAVLDLNKHTCQIFADDQPYTELLHDDNKYSAFFGMKFADGTYVGGNMGSTFTAGLDDIKITYSP